QINYQRTPSLSRCPKTGDQPVDVLYGRMNERYPRRLVERVGQLCFDAAFVRECLVCVESTECRSFNQKRVDMRL
ncbi:hypothetical protein, partial [Paraburkholderia elongata]|uniref:hypothetical protein n=1 Tax=Paraburkholderia elongata TaxID=2675747 RepID=UPI001C12D8E5